MGRGRGGSSRMLRRLLPLAEVVRAARGDGDDVLEADAELAREVDPRLVAERHPRLERDLAAAVEVRLLVSLEPDAVPEAVAEDRVAAGIAGALDRRKRGAVHLATGDARRRALEGGDLRAAHGLPRPRELGRRRAAEGPGARDVALVAVQRAAGVDEHAGAALERAPLGVAVRVRGRGPEQRQAP